MRRHEGPNLLIESDQAHGVLLAGHQVAQGGSQTDGIFQFGQPGAGGEVHRAALVDQQMAGEIGFGPVLADVELVGAGPGVVVDQAGIVAGDVFAMLGELDREAVIWRIV